MLTFNHSAALKRLNEIVGDIPYTHQHVCNLLYRLILLLNHQNIIEISCGYGKATAYLSAAAKECRGNVFSVDVSAPTWNGNTVKDILKTLELQHICNVELNCDARWYLLDLFSTKPGCWIDLAYIDSSHTVEVDSFVALSVWTHLRPGGIIIFDDLDWIPAEHGQKCQTFSRPHVSHVRKIYEYIKTMPNVDDVEEWGLQQIKWSLGFVQKKGILEKKLSLKRLLRLVEN